MTADDMHLVREYATRQSEAAFAELVSRHTNLVYSTALRQSRDPQLAEEITQVVFILLARKAATLGEKTILTGWLYRTACFVSSSALKRERRRQHREQEACMQSELDAQSHDAWNQLAPFLDEAMLRLGQADRDALVLRYFEGRSLQEVGVALGLHERAAQKRVARALDKLRGFFSKRGVNSSAQTIAETISAHSIQAAPVALAQSVTTAAFTKGAVVSTSTLTLIKGALKLMAWTKAKTAIVIGAAALFAAGVTTATIVAAQKARAYEIENYLGHWDSMNIDEATLPNVVMVRPTHYAGKGDWIILGGGPEADSRTMRRAANFDEILETAYGFSPEQMILNTRLPRGQFDLLLTSPNNSRETLRNEIKKQFGIVAHSEFRDMDVLVLKMVDTNAPGIKLSAGGGPNIWTDDKSIKLQGFTMDGITHAIGRFYDQPIVDETGLTNTYDAEAKWDGNLRGKALQTEIGNVLRNQLGLSLTPDRQSVQVLVVEKAH